MEPVASVARNVEFVSWGSGCSQQFACSVFFNAVRIYRKGWKKANLEYLNDPWVIKLEVSDLNRGAD